MKDIHGLLNELDYALVQGSLDGEITDLVYDSRKVTKGSMFVCLKGATFDAHTVANEAVESGAKVLIVQEDVVVPETATVIRV